MHEVAYQNSSVRQHARCDSFDLVVHANRTLAWDLVRTPAGHANRDCAGPERLEYLVKTNRYVSSASGSPSQVHTILKKGLRSNAARSESSSG